MGYERVCGHSVRLFLLCSRNGIRKIVEVKQVKILLIMVSLFGLVLASCVPGGTRPAEGWSGTTFDNDILYMGSRDGKVVAVNSSSSSVEWSYSITTASQGVSCGQTSTPAAIYGTPVADGDLVYVGSYSGKVLALSTAARSQDLDFPQKRNGEWEWACPKTGKESNAIVASPAVGEDAIYVASSNGRVYSLDKEFGDLNWESDILVEEGEKKLWTSPVIQGDTMYVSTFDGHIYALSVKTGDLSPWAFKSEVGFVSLPVIYNDIIFVGSFDRNLYAVKIGGDEALWEFPGGNWFWAGPVVSDGVIYAGCLDGKIYAIDYWTGEQLWSFDAESPIVSSPVLADDLLVVAAKSGDIHVFDTSAKPKDRQLMPVKAISVDAEIWGSLCVQGGVVYVRAQDNCLYALDIEKGWISWSLPLTTKQES
jgi:outer membrane protein assembly factor BamB